LGPHSRGPDVAFFRYLDCGALAGAAGSGVTAAGAGVTPLAGAGAGVVEGTASLAAAGAAVVPLESLSPSSP
jgi:hypothetical protein